MDVEKFLVKAEQALRKRNVPQAIALFRQVLVASPDHGPARAGMLAAFRRKAELKGGPSLLDKAAARSLRAAAAGLRGARQPAALLKTCETGLEKDPTDPVLAEGLAAALESSDRPHEALAVWRHRLEMDGKDVVALKAAGRLHYALKEIPEAVTALEQAAALAPHDPEVQKLRKHLAAEGTLAATRFESAASSRELAKQQGPGTRAQAPQRLHRSAEELADEVAEQRRRLEADPSDTQARLALGRALLRRGEAEAALAVAREGLGASPGDPALAELAEDAGLAAADTALAAARAEGDEAALRQHKAARARLEMEAAERRLGASPGDVAARLRLARAAYRAGETERAIEHFQAVVGDPRVELEAREGLGACFFRQGLFPLARRQLEAALERTGGPGGDRGKDICYSLGLVCERLGDKPGALARYMEVYEVDIHFKDVARKIQELS